VASARAAGARVVALRTTYPDLTADHVIANLAAVTAHYDGNHFAVRLATIG
jgi:phosphoglycolate phosphatase-like HAD superfamily hydrolase